MRFSVIIPVYNAERTINRCLDSLLQQNYPDVELMIVNDGSLDKSGDICKDYAEKYKSIRYFEKKNGGVSSARNVGLDYATGEYVLFVDSDDYVANDYFETIDGYLKNDPVDLLSFGVRNFGCRNNDWGTGYYTVSGEIAVARRAKEAIEKEAFFSLCCRAFSREIIQTNNLRFCTDLHTGEDQTFIFSYATHIKRMAAMMKTLYFVNTEGDTSLSRRPRKDLPEQVLIANSIMQKALRESQLSTEAKAIYDEALAWLFYRSAYSACREIHKFYDEGSMRRKEIRRICKQFALYKIQPVGIKCYIIAMPIIMRCAVFIDALVKINVWRSKNTK